MEQEETVWQDLAQARGWMATDAEALRLERSFRQASDALAFRALERAGSKEGRGEAKAFGSSILRAYAEEQRLVQENASVRAQLDALRRQVDEESDWRRNARALQGTLAEREQELAAINDKHAAETAALTTELTGVKADLASANAAEAGLSDEARQLRMELEVSRARLAAQERRAAEAEQRLHGLQVAGESEAHYKGRITLLEKELDVVSTQLQALSAATESKDAYIASLCQDARAAMTQSKVLAEHITDLSQRAERVVMLDARNAELERLMLEAAAAREALSCEVAARDVAVAGAQERVHTLETEALLHRQQVHTAQAEAAALASKVEDAKERLAAREAAEGRLEERVSQLAAKAAALTKELEMVQGQRTAAVERAAKMEREAKAGDARARAALDAASRAATALERSTMSHAHDLRAVEEREHGLREETLSLRLQLQLRADALKSLQEQLDAAATRAAAAEHERDRAKVCAGLVEEQLQARVTAGRDMAKRLEHATHELTAAASSEAAAQALASQLQQRVSRAEEGERSLSHRAESAESVIRELERRNGLLLRELAMTETVRTAAEHEARARAAAEEQAARALREAADAKSKLEVARAHVLELQGLGRALQGAGEDAALARQLVVEKQSECESLQKQLDSALKKNDVVRAKEKPLLQRVQAAEEAQQKAEAKAAELGRSLRDAKQAAQFAQARRDEAEAEGQDVRRRLVSRERELLVARSEAQSAAARAEVLQDEMAAARGQVNKLAKEKESLSMLVETTQLQLDHARFQSMAGAAEGRTADAVRFVPES